MTLITDLFLKPGSADEPWHGYRLEEADRRVEEEGDENWVGGGEQLIRVEHLKLAHGGRRRAGAE